MNYVVNDLHGAANLIKLTLGAMDEMERGSTLIINGDGAGARGPVMNKIVKIFYEVRRGETDESVLRDTIEKEIGIPCVDIPSAWIYRSVHAGVFRKLMAERYPETFGRVMRLEAKQVLLDTLVPLSRKAKERGIKLVYLPGNGEIVPDDFDVSDITTEKTVAPEERYYQKLYKDGTFGQFDVTYMPYIDLLDEDTLLISTHFLDLSYDEMEMFFRRLDLHNSKISKVVVHYPPNVAPMGRAFEFWTPNKTDLERIDAVLHILDELDVSSLALVYFGHIHLDANDERMDKYPAVMTFRTAAFNYCNWVKPGIPHQI